MLTVSAGLHGGFDITDALDGDAVLVVAVDELIFELANLVDEHTKLVGHVGDVVIACLTPDGELLLMNLLALVFGLCFVAMHTATSILSLPTSSIERMTFFSIFTSDDSFLARSGPKAPG